MSFDIVVIQPGVDQQPVKGLDEVEGALPLGTPAEIRKQLELVFPSIEWSSPTFGLYKAEEGYALELSIPDETHPSSLHLSLHFGQRWEAGASLAFDRMVRRLYESLHWQSFAVSDNSSLLQ